MNPARGSGAVADLFTGILAEEPAAEAIVDGGHRLTFERWWRSAGSAARALRELGVGRGDVVCLLLPSSAEFACCYLGALRLGAVVSGINPRLGPTEIGHILATAAPKVVVTAGPGLPPGAGGAAVRTAGEILTGPADDGFVAVRADDPAVIVWTSGTTGRPKGAWFDHEALQLIARNIGPLSARHDRKLSPVPFAHAGYMTRIYDQLLYRSALVLTPPVWRAEDMLETLAAERVTLGQGVPTQWEKLISLDALAGTDLSALRLVATGASRVPPSLVRAMRERLGCPVVVRYASTELPLAFGTDPGDPVEAVATTVGRPLGDVEVEIRDEAGAPLGPGRAGRIHLRSRAAMRGYWAGPRGAAGPRPADRWITAGDVGSLDADGRLTILGRADDAYIRGGYNVHPAEVETALLRHPAVARVSVVGTPAPVIGEIGVAFVVPAAGRAPAAEELRDWCRGLIADYKVPDLVVFADDLPVNTVHKIDRTELRRRAAAEAAARPRVSRTPSAPGH
ncbi:long-chain fatty acid--CoA ligase [Actinomadura craniellae]|uniref:Long-chain fatty acid--CoA ligase n=1 Tax=Actinomadura craniellae TaxID=2231787 RepID=A0A365HBD9_9ACTN|nr:AMP-binding protein [Actinomadura craniellae]RAY16246.1 long-chain fatty acid--CoA ligase [Actinomadura craniellae]